MKLTLISLLVATTVYGGEVVLEHSTARTKELAAQGDTQALSDLAKEYDRSLRFAEAYSIQIEFAKAGVPESQAWVGNALLTGRQGKSNVKMDAKQGFQWLLLAANQGHGRSMEKVGRCLLKGIGTPKDSVEAYKWLLLARSNHGGDVSLLNQLSLELSTEAAKEGQRRADAFRAQWEQAASPAAGVSLTLEALAGSSAEPVAMICGERFTQGSSQQINGVEVKCLRIDRNSATVCLPPATDEIVLRIQSGKPAKK